MIIPVKCSCGDCPEWAMVELQGDIQVHDTSLLQNGLDVAAMCLSTQGGGLTMTIGYHQLDGKKVPLKKPLAILSKKKLGGEDSKEVEYEAIGILRHKFLFKNRPKALISKPESTAKKQKVQPGAALRASAAAV
mmetsp:Transcript_72929/g.229541  ORF Transcript_72929/g.229541 Transcript_72929/m.229541 type:complete len:134 (-) Transcript_72929:91-492(-)